MKDKPKEIKSGEKRDGKCEREVKRQGDKVRRFNMSNLSSRRINRENVEEVLFKENFSELLKCINP